MKLDTLTHSCKQMSAAREAPASLIQPLQHLRADACPGYKSDETRDRRSRKWDSGGVLALI